MTDKVSIRLDEKNIHFEVFEQSAEAVLEIRLKLEALGLSSEFRLRFRDGAIQIGRPKKYNGNCWTMLSDQKTLPIYGKWGRRP